MNIFDPMVEPGHAEFNEIMFNAFAADGYYTLRVTEADRKSRFRYYYKCLVNHIRLCSKSGSGDVFLAFGTPCLFLVTLFRNFDGVRFLVHNNLEFALRRSRLLKYMYKRIAAKCHLVYLEKRLEKEAVSHFRHLHSEVIQHPVIPVKGVRAIMNQVFISARNLDRSLLSYVCDREADMTVLCNKKFDNIQKENLYMGFIDNFDEMLLGCRKVYIAGNYKYRASGILYKALSIEKMIIVFEDQEYFNEIEQLIHGKNLDCELSLLTYQR